MFGHTEPCTRIDPFTNLVTQVISVEPYASAKRVFWIVDIYFSVVQCKVVSPNDFPDLAKVGDRLRAFEERYNATAQPFQWKFITSDPDELLARLDRTPPIARKNDAAQRHTSR